MMDINAQISVFERQKKEKADVIEQLRKMPIVQIACKRAGVGRTTYYQWRKDDKAFEKATDEAVRDGIMLINDLAESKIISAMDGGNITAAIYWLKNRNPAFAEKLRVIADIKTTEQLTPEQEALVKEAWRLVALPDADANSSNNNEPAK